MPLFTLLSDEQICHHINSAEKYVILASPGTSIQIAKALINAYERLGSEAIQVVFDVSPQVARLGYGSVQAVELLKKHGVVVRHQAGLRIGALIADDAGWSFASFPALVEADPTKGQEAYNAIALTEAQVMMLRSELPPVRSAGSSEVTAVEYPVIGSEPLVEANLEKVKKALVIAPPQSFDLARQSQIYASFIQFVDLRFEGFSVQNRRIQLPKSLPLVSSADKELKNRLKASLKVLGKMEKPKDLTQIAEDLEDLRAAYLVSAGQAGKVILKSKREDFENELTAIEESLETCKQDLLQGLQDSLDKVIDDLVPDLGRGVLENPPNRFKGLFSIDKDGAEDYARAELVKAFPKANDLVSDMKIHYFFKNVTYETLKDKEFEKKIKSVIPESVLAGALLEEEVVAQSSLQPS